MRHLMPLGITALSEYNKKMFCRLSAVAITPVTRWQFVNQVQSARICRALATSSSEPENCTFNLPDLRVTETLTVVNPLFFMRS